MSVVSHPYDVRPTNWKKLEAQWKRSCAQTHRLWCYCGDWISHVCSFRTSSDSSCRHSEDDTGRGPVEPGPTGGAITTVATGGGNGDPTDEELLDAAER